MKNGNLCFWRKLAFIKKTVHIMFLLLLVSDLSTKVQIEFFAFVAAHRFEKLDFFLKKMNLTGGHKKFT